MKMVVEMEKYIIPKNQQSHPLLVICRNISTFGSWFMELSALLHPACELQSFNLTPKGLPLSPF